MAVHPQGSRGSPTSDPEEQGNRTQASAAYHRIKADVTSGQFEPDQRLRIEDLRKAYSTGASPLREALSRLAAEGLIVSIGQRGFRVPPVSIDDLRDITNTRILLETEALRRSIKNGDDEWEVRVVASFHRLTKVEAGERVDFAVWEEANRQFHAALLSACPSRWLMRFYGTMFDQHRRYRSMSIQAANERRSVHDEHQRIKEASLARDVAAACREAEMHIRRTAEIDEALLTKQITTR